MADKCARCGAGPNDLRELWMACFYAMNELDVPLRQVEIQGGRHASQSGTTRVEPFGIDAPTFNESSAEPRDYRFFTMTVCKDCRADWLEAIEKWCHSKPTDPDACGSGFYTRQHGTSRQVPPDDLTR